MTANIIQFPSDRVRSSGTLTPERREHYVERARSFMAHVRYRDTGVLLTPAEQELAALQFIEGLESVAAQVDLNK